MSNSTENSSDNIESKKTSSSVSQPLVFISHDSRDADIAEEFSNLLSSVSAGVLKSFRSSDRKGMQGIEYGVEWYPAIMENLESASDVVCLLTSLSTERPWILYEAGVARGKLNTPVHGVAVGVTLAKAAVGPFAQFQNCGDDEESLTSLVMQLVDRIPNSEPNRDVVQFQVQAFKRKVDAILSARATNSDLEEQVETESDDSGVVKMFEEVKVMFQDLPRHIERRLDPIRDEEPYRRKKRTRLHPEYIDQICDIMETEPEDPLFLLIVASEVGNYIPWFYELGKNAYDAVTTKNDSARVYVKRFVSVLDFISHGPGLKMAGYNNPRLREDMSNLTMYLDHRISRLLHTLP